MHHTIAALKQAIKQSLTTRAADFTKLPKLECVPARKGLALPRASHSGEIALVGSQRLRAMLATVPVLFAHNAVTVAENK